MSNGIKLYTKETKDIFRRTSWFDWGLVKIACLVFGILIVAFYAPIRTWLDWYCWLLIGVVLVAPAYYTVYVNPKRKMGCDPLDLDCRYSVARREMALWEWGLIKWACVFFGITIAITYPTVLSYFEWYWWGIIFVALIAVPMYHINVRQKPKRSQKNNRIAKAKYTYSEDKQPPSVLLSSERIKHQAEKKPWMYKTTVGKSYDDFQAEQEYHRRKKRKKSKKNIKHKTRRI